ncbi:hypothetical protein XENOCAPTIV_030208 [Xenoophorus captivus]|uniref:Uncharacterized protein n=1 Tax=Xenoophorus captivus TaxID=1517983 RepID=A0ABV0SE48_9TELE
MKEVSRCAFVGPVNVTAMCVFADAELSVLQLLHHFPQKTFHTEAVMAILQTWQVNFLLKSSVEVSHCNSLATVQFVFTADLPNGRAARSSAPIYLNVLSPAAYRGSPAPDLDDVFGPADSPRAREEAASPRWVTFTDDRPPPPDEPAPPPPPDSPPPDTPSSTPSTPGLSPGPPPNEPPPSPPQFSPGSPPPFTPIDSPPSIVLGPPPPDEPAPPLPPDFSPADSPTAFPEEEGVDEEVLQFAGYACSPAPISPVPPLPAERRSPRTGVTSPLVYGNLGGKRTPEGAYQRYDVPDVTGSPRELTPSFRGTPPPLPPTAYRSIMSSPGPYPGSSECCGLIKNIKSTFR